MASLFDDPFEFEDNAPSQHVRQSAIPNPPQPAIPLTVSELTADIRAVLESGIGQVWVEGELSNCKLWQTGHLYFTLKDTGAQIRGVMFRSAVRLLKFKPLDGQAAAFQEVALPPESSAINCSLASATFGAIRRLILEKPWSETMKKVVFSKMPACRVASTMRPIKPSSRSAVAIACGVRGPY